MIKHYYPNRTTQRIQEDLALINSLDINRPRNHRKSIPALPEWIWSLTQILAIAGFVFCMYALFLEVFYQ